MKVKLVTIPILDPAAAEDDLNRFLSSHQIVSVNKEFVQIGHNAYWSFVVTYLDSHKAGNAKRASVDYREVLNDKDFKRYARLRELRNELARQDGKPAYAIFTNEQLASLVTNKVVTRNAMAAIEGIGESRIAQHADVFLDVLQSFEQEEPD